MDTTGTVAVNMQKAISPVYMIERPAISPDLLDRYAKKMGDTAAQLFEQEQNRVRSSFNTASGSPVLTDHRTSDGLVKYQDAFLTSRQWNFVQTSVKINSGILLSNTRIFTPPYEIDWVCGTGSPLSKLDGSMITMGTDGSSVSGIGFHISSPQQVLATIEPVGEYEFNWTSFENYPQLYSSGGIGITVYRNAGPDPVLNRRATLYQVQGPREFKGDAGRGSLSDLHAGVNEPGFFRFPLVPFDIILEAQQNYLVWIWTWQIQAGSQGTAFLSFVGCKVPMIFLSTNPVTYPVLH